MKKTEYDVIIIGAGAIGCAIARELSRYELRIAVLEKNSDVAGETTGRNSAVVHAGFNNAPGSMMARFCVEGNKGFRTLCRELDVPFQETGKLVLGFDAADARRLESLLAQGRANGCRDLEILEGEALGACLREHGMEGIGGSTAALWSPHTGITNPFLYCVALAENARANGAEFFLDTEVTGIRQVKEYEMTGIRQTEECEETESDDGNGCVDECRFIVTAVHRRGGLAEFEASGNAQAGIPEAFEYRSRFLINCAGLQADRIAAMAGVNRYRIYPCRGEYFVLDKYELAMPVYPAPREGEGGLGVHLTPTMEGNILIGPSAEYLTEADSVQYDGGQRTDGADLTGSAAGECVRVREDYACTRPVMEELLRQAKLLMPAIGDMQSIGNYSGVRPKLSSPEKGGYRDFVIRAEEDVPGLIDLVGIESPGLTASVPIAGQVCRMIAGMEHNSARVSGGLVPKKSFDRIRRGILRFREQDPKKQAELIASDPDYGEIICRCQQITRREIRDAIENPLGARSLAAIKYRAWATTGRCSGGYCLPRICEMLVRDYGMRPEEIRYRNAGSEMFAGRVK